MNNWIHGTSKKFNPKPMDVYNWRWDEEYLSRHEEKKRAGTLYWCMSQICIVHERDGEIDIRDTYWGTFASFGSHNKRLQKIDCKFLFLGNLNDYEECQGHEFKYYDDSDCLNISHANMTRGGFYLKKGAKKSEAQIRAGIEDKIADHLSDRDYAEREIVRLRAVLEEGDFDNVYF